MKEISYKKITFDESINRFTLELRGKDEEGNKSFYKNGFPLDKFLEIEDGFTLLDGDVYFIYIEQPVNVTTKSWLDGSIQILTKEEQTICDDIANKAIAGSYDDLNKPPSNDEQVQKFIDEFFSETENTPVQQKDLLAEFFAEIEEEDK